VPAAGHIHPSLEIVRELTVRGHRVTYTVTDEFAAAVEAVGAEPVHVLPQVEAAYEDDRPDLVLYDIGGWPGGRCGPSR
jgi:UDP:flavonoid glycosyltransferase YjiC (YdhE family)